MPPRIKPGTDEEILADWDTGDYSKAHGGTKTQSELSYKHHCSIGRINKLVKGREPQNLQIVNNFIHAKQELAGKNEISVNAVNKVVDERTKHIEFFTEAAVKNVKTAVDKIGAETSQAEHRMLADTILKGRETVLGKSPETAIQINTNGNTQLISSDMNAQDAARAYADFMAGQ